MRRDARGAGRLVGAALAAGCILASAGCGSAAGTGGGTARSGPINVVAGENFWGNITSQIGGSHVKVTSIIADPNDDPHSYEADPTDAAAMAGARFVIENGVGYDDFVSKLVSTAGGSKQVLNVQRLVGVSGDDPNPHLWYSPTYVTEAAQAIEKQLASDDSASAPTFRANLTAFLTAYQPYLDIIKKIKARYGGEAISFTERVPGYLVDAAGLHLGTPATFSQAVEDGTDPTPQDTAAFNADLKERKVKVLLYNAQVADSQTTEIKKMATGAGVPIVGVSETIPRQYQTFQAWQIAQAQALLAALGG